MTRFTALLVALGFACAPAHADRIAEPGSGRAVTPAPAPYTIELLTADGRPLPTYRHRGRFYIPGEAGERYVIRVTNPTPRRVEAVLSVDGLDVIDGETADFVGKRGYIVPAYGELRIEGFRTSLRDVAAFRFSSVASSYAGRKGKARHVGVIGLAVFEERPAPAIVHRPPPRPIYDERRSPTAPAAGSTVHGDRPAAAGEAAPSPRREADSAPAEASGRAGCCGPAKRRSRRPGLGTEFGERRHSAVSFTRFERNHARRPDALTELRYNDAHGLIALGIPVRPRITPSELETRETASPFPGSRFATPPPGGALRR